MANISSIFLLPCNKSSSYGENQLTENVYFRVTFATVLSVVFFTSVPGGIFVCYVIVSRKLVEKVIWLYLFILAVADCGMSLFTIPTFIAACFDESFLSISWICSMNISSMIFFGSWSIFTLAAISIHKFNFVSKPFESLSNRGTRGFKRYIASSIVLSLIFTLPPFFGFSSFNHIKGRKWCSICSSSKVKDIIFMSVVGLFGYAIPLCIIITCCIRTYNSLERYTAVKATIRRMSAIQICTEKRVILRTLFVIVGVFVITWTPLLFYLIIGITGMKFPIMFIYVSYFFMFLQGSINPLVYYYRHRVFKDVFRNLCGFKETVKKQPSVTFVANSERINVVRPDPRKYRIADLKLIDKTNFTSFDSSTGSISSNNDPLDITIMRRGTMDSVINDSFDLPNED